MIFLSSVGKIYPPASCCIQTGFHAISASCFIYRIMEHFSFFPYRHSPGVQTTYRTDLFLKTRKKPACFDALWRRINFPAYRKRFPKRSRTLFIPNRPHPLSGSCQPAYRYATNPFSVRHSPVERAGGLSGESVRFFQCMPHFEIRQRPFHGFIAVFRR